MIFDNTDTNQKIYDDLLKLRRGILNKVELCDRIVNYLDVVYSYDNGDIKKTRLFEQEKTDTIDAIISELDRIYSRLNYSDDDIEAITGVIERINFVKHMQSLNDKAISNASNN